ncbi:MAG: prevent-host-death protein [Alphaproteobacteria bacterium]|nr:prevent-host-death protein [Alphaproteobacteria bacterium]
MSIRETRAAMGRIDRVLAEAGEIMVTRHGKVLARMVPATPVGPRPSHDRLRRSLPKLGVRVAALLRAERDRR